MTIVDKCAVGFNLDHFEICGKIGSGGSAEVFKAKSLQPGFAGNEYAIKKIRKNKNYTKKIKKEVEIHKPLKYKSIVEFYEFFEDNNYYYIVLELCEQGSLQEYIKYRHYLPEEEACQLIKQVIEGVKYLHRRDIIHRDLSLKNLLLTKYYKVKIADFGLAIESNDCKKNSTIVGTANFMAPEVFDGHYNFKTDCWSVGCVLYALLYGAPPFDSEHKNDIKMRIRTSKLSFPDTASVEAKELLVAMLQKNPEDRIDIQNALSYAFFQKYERFNKVQQKRRDDNVMISLSNSTSYSRGRGTSRKHRYKENITFDEHHNNYTRKNSPAVENHLSYSSMQNCPSYLVHNSVPSKQTSSAIREYEPLHEIQENSDRLYSFKADQFKTSTKIHDTGQKCCSYSRECYIPKDNSIHQSISSYKQNLVQLYKNSGDSSRNKENKNMVNRKLPDKCLTDALTPLTAWRLKARRHRIKNFFISILGGNGPICLEILKCKKNKEYVSCVYFISRDGLTVNIFSPKEKNAASNMPLLPEENEGENRHFNLKDLPEIHWKNYQHVKRFVDIVKASTPKIVICEEVAKNKVAKCTMMENTPDPKFEMYLYEDICDECGEDRRQGLMSDKSLRSLVQIYQVIEAGSKRIIKDRNNSEVSENDSNIRDILLVFENMKGKCKNTEVFSNCMLNSNFPIKIGRLDHVCELYKDLNKEHVSSKTVQPCSLNGTVSTIKSSDISKIMDSTPSRIISPKSLVQLWEESIFKPNKTLSGSLPELKKCDLVDGKWVVAEYIDGIEMVISLEDNRCFFRDTITKLRLPNSQHPDIVNRLYRDKEIVLQCAWTNEQEKKKG